MAEPIPIRVALDWTPNTLHTGLYIALKRGLYSAAGLTVTLSAPDAGYTTTPARLLESGAADLAICPSESILAYAESGKTRLQAIYAITQTDASGIVAATPLNSNGDEDASSRVDSPADLVGKDLSYGSYGARYEDDIVRAMVSHAGGEGAKLRVVGPPEGNKLGLFDAVLEGSVGATWVFLPWEGVEAELKGRRLSVFRPGEYGVPYGYSPLIARKVGSSSQEGGLSDEVLRRFVKATREGYAEAVRDALGAVDVLRPHCEPARVDEFLLDSQERINAHLGDVGKLGSMEAERWDGWVGWLAEKQLTKLTVADAKDLWTNEFNV